MGGISSSIGGNHVLRRGTQTDSGENIFSTVDTILLYNLKIMDLDRSFH